MKPHIVRKNGHERYHYEFAFTPIKPLAKEERERFAAQQLLWLKEWKPYSWHFVQ